MSYERPEPNFNPLPSHEGRPLLLRNLRLRRLFQSTPLTRGETVPVSGLHRSQPISIHSPHTRGDDSTGKTGCIYQHFNPLPSYEGRRLHPLARSSLSHFNPLPSYEGRHTSRGFFASVKNFNPLPSYEGRQGVPNPPA